LYEKRRYLAFPEIRTRPIDFAFKKSEHGSMKLSEWRKEQGLSLEALADKLSKSKGHLSAVENDGYATARLALDIEKLTDGKVDAASLNPEIRDARRAAA